MKVKLLFTALAVLLSFSCFSQSKDKYVYVSSTLNLYPELESYSYFSEIEARQDNLLLNFLTRNSGTFILEELPDRIILYRVPLLAVADGDLEELREQIHITLVHEIAHFYGINDDELHRLGWA